MRESSFRCEHCGQVIRKKQRWQPDPQLHATIKQAAEQLDLSVQQTHQLIKDRWITVAGTYYGPRAKAFAAGVTYVTRESITNAAKRKPNILKTADKKQILQTLSDIGVIGPLKWSPRKYIR